MKTNTEYKTAARTALKGHWAPAVLVTALFFLIVTLSVTPYIYEQAKLETYVQENMPELSSGNAGRVFSTMMQQMLVLAQDPAYVALRSKANGSMALMYLLLAFLLLPLTVGMYNAFRLLLVQGDDRLVSNTVHIATSKYWHKLGGMVLMNIFISLWSLLCLIPGIIKTFSYALTPYILEENPEVSALDAIRRSQVLMKGHKFDLFWLMLSFIGWFLLCLLTCGVGFFWLYPYMQTAMAAFYEDVKADHALNGGLL